MREKNQVVLPLNLGIYIPEGDFVLKVAKICESLDNTELFNTYLRAWRKRTKLIFISENRPQALEALTSEEGTLLRMNKSIQVEGVFGVL